MLEFETEVIAESLSLWVSWNAAEGLKEVLLHFSDGSVQSISPLTAFCDTPLTISLFQKMKKVKKVTKQRMAKYNAL